MPRSFTPSGFVPMDALRYMVMEADCPARYEAEPLAIPDRASATGWGWDAGPGW